MRQPVNFAGLTSMGAAPLVAPVRVRFKDVQSGQWMEGLSEPKIDPNHWRIHLKVQAFAPCRFEAHRGRQCGCKKKLTGVREGPANLNTNVFANWVRAGILGTTTTITDTGGSGRSVTKTVDGGVVAASTLICAGTGATVAAVADTNMQTQTESVANPTVNAVAGSGSSGTFTVTGTVTATADRAYAECGIKITTTTTAWVFLICHDSFSVLNVSNTGTLAITYTFTNS